MLPNYDYSNSFTIYLNWHEYQELKKHAFADKSAIWLEGGDDRIVMKAPTIEKVLIFRKY
jgi:hypothetical protein